MRVLLVHPGASWSTADVEDGLRHGLEQHDVEVIRYRLDGRIERAAKWLKGAWKQARKDDPGVTKPTVADVVYQASSDALTMALRHQVDAVVVVSGMFLHPDILILMKRAGLTVSVLFTESPYDTARELEVARLVDCCWTNERSVLPDFRAVNPRTAYLPHAWHPHRHRPGLQPGDEQVRAHDVVFVGSAFRERIAWFQAIDWAGIDLGLYGQWDGLPKGHPLRQFVQAGPVPNQVAAALYRRAAIGLNLYRRSVGQSVDAPYITHAESLNPRAYELAACGAFHLSDARAEVREVFGPFVPTFETPEEASTLIRTWLADPEQRAEIAAQLPACVAASTWTERAGRLIGDLLALQARAA